MKKWRIILCLLLMCTVWLAACAGKQPSAPEQPDGGTNVEQPENPDDGDEIVKRTFTGTATDSFGGALGGVTVTLNGVSTTTDGQGVFTLSEVEKGTTTRSSL